MIQSYFSHLKQLKTEIVSISPPNLSSQQKPPGQCREELLAQTAHLPTAQATPLLSVHLSRRELQGHPGCEQYFALERMPLGMELWPPKWRETPCPPSSDRLLWVREHQKSKLKYQVPILIYKLRKTVFYLFSPITREFFSCPCRSSGSKNPPRKLTHTLFSGWPSSKCARGLSQKQHGTSCTRRTAKGWEGVTRF